MLPGLKRKDLLKLRREIENTLAKRRLVHFVRQAWKVLEPATEYCHNWHIDAVCEHLEAQSSGQIQNLLINVPPGCMKSLLVSVFWPCWEWLNNPQSRWMFASYSDELSVSHSMMCRTLVEHEWYKGMRNWKLVQDDNQKTRFSNNKTGWRIATSVGGSGTGKHPDRIVVDDPLKALEAHNRAARDKVIRWWRETMSTRGQTRKATRTIIMQRLHENDLSGYVLAEDDYEHLMLPMEFESGRRCKTSLGSPDIRTTDGELLWPQLFPRESVDKRKRELGTYGVSGQFQQNPTPTGGSIFSRTNFRYFTVRKVEQSDLQTVAKEPTGFNRYLANPPVEHMAALPRRMTPDREMVFELRDGDKTKRVFGWDCWWFQTCDTAQKTKEENDYTAVGTFIVTPDNELLVYQVVRDKIIVPKQYGFLVEQRNRFPWLSGQYIEDAASGIGLLQKGLEDGMAFRPLKAVGDKVARAMNASTLMEQGKLYFLSPSADDPADWLVPFEGELLVFPRGENDDQVDVLSHAANVVVEHAGRSAGVRDVDLESVPTLDELMDGI